MPQLTKKELQVIDVKQETSNTRIITLAIGSITFSYQPGQYVSLELPSDDNHPNIHSFSLCSSPTDNGKLMIATKIDDHQYKQKFADLKQGDNVKITGPFGRFTLHENNQRPAVMLSDGIGITPLRSMIKYATDKQLSMSITLIYSNKTPEDILFKSDLAQMQKKNKNFNVIHTLTHPQDSEFKTIWQGHVGRIDAQIIGENVPDGSEPIFYICGSSSIVIDLLKELKKLNVPPERIKAENFIGYE